MNAYVRGRCLAATPPNGERGVRTRKIDPATAATRVLEATYPPRVRAWIEQHGGLTSKVIWRELISLYAPCAQARVLQPLPHPPNPRNRDARLVFHFDPAGGSPVGGRIAPVATWIHGSKLPAAEIDQTR